MTKGTRPISPMHSKSFTGSYGMFLTSAGAAACEVFEVNISVWPSGAARATKAPAMVPLPPGLLSTVTGWPTWAVSFSAKMRAIVSVPLPAPNRITMLIGLLGHAACAATGPAAATAADESRN